MHQPQLASYNCFRESTLNESQNSKNNMYFITQASIISPAYTRITSQYVRNKLLQGNEEKV